MIKIKIQILKRIFSIFFNDVKETLFRFKNLENIANNQIKENTKNNYEKFFFDKHPIKRQKDLRFTLQIFSIFYFLLNEKKKKIKILDWGGGYGQQAFDIISKYSEIVEIEWHILEQKKIIEHGKKYIEIPNVKFIENITEFYDLCFFNGSISYLDINKVFPNVAKYCEYISLSRVGLSLESTKKIFDNNGLHEEYIYNHKYFFDKIKNFFDIIEVLDDEKLKFSKRTVCTFSDFSIFILAKTKNFKIKNTQS